MSSKIFEEAIADAKKLREVAEANAKKAVLEAVTPKIREFIESELLEGKDSDEEEANEEEEVEEALDESALSNLSSLLGLDIKSKKIFNESASKAFDSLDKNQKKEFLAIRNKINQNIGTLTNSEISNKESNLKENSRMSKYYEVDLKALREMVEGELEEMMHSMDEEMEEGSYMEGEMEEGSEMEEDSLEEMLSELKLVLDLGDDVEEDQFPEELRGNLEDDDEEGEDVDLAEPGDDAEGEEEMDFMMPGADGEEEVEVDEKMLAEEILRIRKMIQEGNMDHHFGGKGAGKAGVKGAFGGTGSGKAGVKKAFGGGAEGQDVFTNPPAMNKLAEAFRTERRKNRALGEKLNKYRSAVDTLREQLEDLNLFNAKLLYVNKLLQSKSLNESEKKSVIKALDEAKSLNEAKSLYKSLTETFARGKKGKTLTESRHRGSSSRATTSSASKSSNPSEIDRWQRLAGLK